MTIPRRRERLPAGPPRRAWLVVGFAAFFALQAHVLFLKPYGVPATPAGIEHQRRPVGGATVLTQDVVIEAAGFDGMTVWPWTRGEVSSGPAVIFDLSIEDEGGWQRVFELERPASEVFASSRFELTFQPLEASAGRRYRIVIRAPDLPDDADRGFWVTREDGYQWGALFIDGVEQWGDLRFATSASRATAFRRIEHAVRGLVPVPGVRWALVAALAVFDWAIWVFAAGMLRDAGWSPGR